MTRRAIHALFLAPAVALIFACASKKDGLSCVTAFDCPDGQTCRDGYCVERPDDTATVDKDSAVTDETADDAPDDMVVDGTESDISDERDEESSDITLVDEDLIEVVDESILDDTPSENDPDADDISVGDTEEEAIDDNTTVDDATTDEDTVVNECLSNNGGCAQHCSDTPDAAPTCSCDANYLLNGDGHACDLCQTDALCGAACLPCGGDTPHCKNNGNGTTLCVACTEDTHCDGATPHCLLSQNLCVACRTLNDCGALEICLSAAHTCAPNFCGDGERLATPGLGLELSFNEGVGATANDLSGNGNHAALNGAAWGNGRFGKGIAFSGAESAYLAESISLKAGAQMTVTAWIKSATMPSNYVTIIQKDGDAIRNYGLFITGSDQPATQGTVLFSLTSDAPHDWRGPVSSVSVIDGNWHHLAGVYNGIEMKVFIDGVERGSQAVSVTPADTSGGVWIGGGFTGIIDEVRLYHRALGTAELAELANRRVHLPFEESGGTIAFDLSGNARNGTLHNAVARVAGRFGSGLFFDGVDDALQWDYAGNTPVNNFTMMAWFTTDVERYTEVENTTTTSGTLIDNHYLFWPDNRDTEAGAGISVGTNGISVYEHGNGYMPPLAVYDASIGTGWNHVAVTYTDRQPRIYLNGVLVREGLVSPKSVVYAPQLAGVSAGFYGTFSGKVDDLRIYDRPLDAFEITAIMQNSYHDELCDDGNFADGDGCSPACTTEPIP